MRSSPADWQLPPGVDRGLWDYVHDANLAKRYDRELSTGNLPQQDRRFVEAICPNPGRLLDLGCGTGRILIALAEKGYWVLGVDLSEEMLRVSREKAAKKNLTINLLKANLVDLAGIQSESFDYAVCLFSTFGMIQGRNNRQQFLQHIYRLLKPRGRFVLHVHNRWFNFWNHEGRRWLVKDFFRWIRKSERYGNKQMPPYGGLPSLTLHLFTRREVTRLLQETGFRLLEVRPISLSPDGEVRNWFWFGWLRAYGYLFGAAK